MSGGQGHNSDTPAAKEFRGFIERIERLHEERKSIGNDIADLFKELAGRGYDKEAAKTVIKIRAADNGLETWTARSHVVDTYLAALGMLPETGTDIATRTHVHVHEESDGGAIAAVEGSAQFLADAVGVEPPPSGHSRSMSISPLEPREAGGLKGFGFTVKFEDSQSVEPTSSPAMIEPTGAAPDLPAAPVEDFVPAFLRKDHVPVDVRSPEFILKLRPFCQDVENCHGYGRDCAVCKARVAA